MCCVQSSARFLDALIIAKRRLEVYILYGFHFFLLP